MKHRKKSSEIHRETEYLFSKKVSFDEVFPEIEEVVVEVVESGHGLPRHYSGHKYTRQDISEYIDCHNPMCYDGGFSIGRILREMVEKKQTDLNTLKVCQGNETSPKGKRIYRDCANFFRIKVHIDYKDSIQQNSIPESAET